ncbi:putative rhamnogalacturonase [Eremomyces bilateralis CBS 781.70]|uniref:rhamnogalacturonan endolyase n=1 Tax=Eremomyces bilateralis CBS 781.70 TaxID=1392243 RepID=A0A6G1G8K0_9PEZI|nr:putative rhamnogalacturonase [Eremomyces bilateralis CBS 781.70]KAF1814398.1 putative rhamnogalacturonase [Eremomyces bilateralis CBS 781.70]
MILPFTALFFVVNALGVLGQKPFLEKAGDRQWRIGNNLWSIVQGRDTATKLQFKGRDLVSGTKGHYLSIGEYGNNGKTSLQWTSADIVQRGSDFIDIRFNSNEGEMHWVIKDNEPGAHQYFVNKRLPRIGEFRSILRLDPGLFPKGRTSVKDGNLPSLSDIKKSTKTQDETWKKSDGSYITKYDWSDNVRSMDFYGVYGGSFGAWYMHAGRDYFNGNHLKQELMVHRETNSGDAVMLNMIHGTHFQASSADEPPSGKMWGPWFLYFNGGSVADAKSRYESEVKQWPYSWVTDAAYKSRGVVSGDLTLQDGRPAAGAAVFLGDNNPTKTDMDMGTTYYYTAYADAEGQFSIPNVRSGTYGLRAWANGGNISDVLTTFSKNGVTVTAGQTNALGALQWPLPGRQKVFQVGEYDRKSTGFGPADRPMFQAGLIDRCPASLTYTVGRSSPADWCFGMYKRGTWTIAFTLDDPPPAGKQAILTVSLAGYSGMSCGVTVNKKTNIGSFRSSNPASDPGTYRSATVNGEWRLWEYKFSGSALQKGANTVEFTVNEEQQWRGILWDTVVLEFA